MACYNPIPVITGKGQKIEFLDKWAINKYPYFEPNKTIQSWILENENTGYLIICGNNYETKGHTEFKFTKEKKMKNGEKWYLTKI